MGSDHVRSAAACRIRFHLLGGGRHVAAAPASAAAGLAAAVAGFGLAGIRQPVVIE